jgi:hypothetical protein
MGKRKIPSEKLVTLEHMFNVIERHECGHSNSVTGRDVGMSVYTAENVKNTQGK